jgi:transposase
VIVTDPTRTATLQSVFKIDFKINRLKLQRPPQLPDDEERAELSAHLSRNLCLNAAEVGNFKKIRRRIHPERCDYLLHEFGFSYKKAKAVPGKAKKEEQELLILEYYRLKQEGKIYFADSTHPQHTPVISHGWIKKGQDFEVLTHNSSRYHLNINGAVDVENLDVVTRRCERVNTASICEIFRAIRDKKIEGQTTTLIMDNGAYNKTQPVKELAKSLGIQLVYLPPYSPNLNPIERLWKLSYETRAKFEDACTDFFRYTRRYRRELSTLLTDEFHVMSA